MIIGGLGSLWGTLAGGIILGVAQAIGAQIDPGWQLLAGHLVFLLVLAVRPEGLFPKVRGMTRAAFRVEHATRSSRIGMAVVRWSCSSLLAAAPAWGGRDDLRLLGEIFAYVALASLWNLLAGYAGLVSVGQQAYVGLGGYVLFASTILAGVHPLLADPARGRRSARGRRAAGRGADLPPARRTTSPSAPGWWPRCSGCSPRRSRRSAAAPASACRRRS